MYLWNKSTWVYFCRMITLTLWSTSARCCVYKTHLDKTLRCSWKALSPVFWSTSDVVLFHHWLCSYLVVVASWCGYNGRHEVYYHRPRPLWILLTGFLILSQNVALQVPETKSIFVCVNRKSVHSTGPPQRSHRCPSQTQGLLSGYFMRRTSPITQSESLNCRTQWWACEADFEIILFLS